MKGLNWRTLGDATQWLSTWIDSGNKTIRCTAKDVVFDLYDDEGDILSFIAPSKINIIPGSTLSVAITNSGFSI